MAQDESANDRTEKFNNFKVSVERGDDPLEAFSQTYSQKKRQEWRKNSDVLRTSTIKAVALMEKNQTKKNKHEAMKVYTHLARKCVIHAIYSRT